MGVQSVERTSLNFIAGILRHEPSLLSKPYTYLKSPENRQGLEAELRVGRIIEQYPYVVSVMPTERDGDADFHLKDLIVMLDSSRKVDTVSIQVKRSNRQMRAFNRISLGRKRGIEPARRVEWLRDARIIPIIGGCTISRHGVETPVTDEQIKAWWEVGLAGIEKNIVVTQNIHEIQLQNGIPIIHRAAA